MLITIERKVPQNSYASQNDHKSKGYPSQTAAAFTMQKSDKGDLRRLQRPPLKYVDFQKSYFSALSSSHINKIQLTSLPSWPPICSMSFSAVFHKFVSFGDVFKKAKSAAFCWTSLVSPVCDY